MTFEEWYKETGSKRFGLIYKFELRGIWEAATAAERERCAKVCDLHLLTLNGDYADGWNDASAECAAAIRARG